MQGMFIAPVHSMPVCMKPVLIDLLWNTKYLHQYHENTLPLMAVLHVLGVNVKACLCEVIESELIKQTIRMSYNSTDVQMDTHLIHSGVHSRPIHTINEVFS